MTTKQKHPLSILLWLLLAVCLVSIFLFSTENAAESTNSSDNVLRVILNVIHPGFDTLSDAGQEALVRQYSFAIRKTAHFSIYAALGLLLFLTFIRTFTKNTGRAALLALAAAALYATTDEIHQYFVPGRSCELRDMLIDTLGALCGILAAALIRHLILRRRKR